MPNYTIVGCYDDPKEGDFVEFVEAEHPHAAVFEAVQIDDSRVDARIIAVFEGHQPDISESEVGVPRYGRDF